MLVSTWCLQVKKYYTYLYVCKPFLFSGYDCYKIGAPIAPQRVGSPSYVEIFSQAEGSRISIAVMTIAKYGHLVHIAAAAAF